MSVLFLPEGWAVSPHGPYDDVRDVLYAAEGHGGDSHKEAPLLYPVRERLFREWRPQSILEYGTLAGFVLLTALHASPVLKVCAWVDAELHTPGSNRIALRNVRWYAREAGRKLQTWHGYGRDDLDACPWRRFDVVSIDADHSEDECFADLCHAERFFMPGRYVVDDWAASSHGDDIHRAVARFREACDPGVFRLDEYETENGLAVMTRTRAW